MLPGSSAPDPQVPGSDSAGSTASGSKAGDAQRVAGDTDNPSLSCPNCSNALEPLKCKLLCKRCGYFMSCADYY